MKANYNSHIIVFISTMLACALPAYATEGLTPFAGWHGPPEIKQGDPAKLDFLKKYEAHKAGLNGKINKRVIGDSDNMFSADLNTGYGRLFFPI